jgi:hypothetical protein
MSQYKVFLTVIILFYKKLFFPSLLIGIFVSLVGMMALSKFSTGLVAVFYPFIAFLAQYSIYEVQNPNEYYLGSIVNLGIECNS